MRIKVNSFNLGLVYETSIICSADYEDYFKQTASFLEEKYAVKTFLYVYDRDPLTSKVKLILSTCYSNIFMLTAGVAEKAAVAKKIAKRFHLPFLSLQDKLDEAAKSAPATYWLGDGVHPTAFGHQLIADEWIKTFKRLRK